MKTYFVCYFKDFKEFEVNFMFYGLYEKFGYNHIFLIFDSL